jgi:hypothetical protein
MDGPLSRHTEALVSYIKPQRHWYVKIQLDKAKVSRHQIILPGIFWFTIGTKCTLVFAFFPTRVVMKSVITKFSYCVYFEHNSTLEITFGKIAYTLSKYL